MMKIYVKYMVSLRCKMMVQAVLEALGLHCAAVGLGEVEIVEARITAEQHRRLRVALLEAGLELLDEKKAELIEKIKAVIVDMVYATDELPKTKNSEYLSGKLHYDYTYLANLFSEATGTTIEHYIIGHKIERVKELLLYGELNLTQISYKLSYSSVAHLSTQFKKVTGLTPTFFKQLRYKKRIILESVNDVSLFCNSVSASDARRVSFAT